MADAWVMQEMGSVDLKDGRINARLREVLSQLGQRPTASIPAACGGHADMTAAYRLFDNEKVTFARILAPHAERTRQRMAAQPRVLLVQDTTEIDLTRPTRQVQGAGSLNGGTRQGLFLHPLHAFSTDGTPLGTLSATHWVRQPGAGNAPLTRAQEVAIPIAEKESWRWLQMLRVAQQQAPHCPHTQLICVCDSEADIYEILAEPPRIDWIVRACHDRALIGGTDREMTAHLRQRLLAQPRLYTDTINVRARALTIACDRRRRRQPRRARQAQVHVRSASVTLRPAWRADRKLPAVTVNAVLVSEVDAPEGDEPIEWLLLTNLPVADAALTREVVAYYGIRWMIEIFFRVLKSGCRIEARRFQHLDRLQACLAVYLIIAWRTLYVCRLARACPQVDCQAVFEPAEWKAVWTVLRHTAPPSEPPALAEFVLMVAQLGGYVRSKNSPPGPQTVWIGLQRTYDFALCWNSFGPQVAKGDVDV
jgi:hypothetical protein